MHKIAVATLLLLAACTAGQRDTASAVLTNAATLAPVVCAAIGALGVPVTACGPVAADVAAVAQVVGGILSTWPKSARSIAMPPTVVLRYRGVDVTMPSDAAAYVQAQLAAKGATR